jgi:hypothetical protein
MSKKNFAKGLSSLLGEETKVRPPEKSVEIRATLVVREDLMEAIRNIAYWDRLKIKDIFEDMMRDKIAEYEKKHGKIRQR